MIVWINGTHGAGKTTTAPLVQQLVQNSRVLDAERIGETLMDITPGLSASDNFQHWPPWRSLVVETARRVLDFTGGALIMPMTVLVEEYWREIGCGFAAHRIPVYHFVLHADSSTLRRRILDDDRMGPSSFRLLHLDRYEDAFRAWLSTEAEIIDTSESEPSEIARMIAETLARGARASVPKASTNGAS